VSCLLLGEAEEALGRPLPWWSRVSKGLLYAGSGGHVCAGFNQVQIVVAQRGRVEVLD
jgi:hypothetical protein